MKHLFVINPCAGGKNHISEIESRLKALNSNAEVYVTRAHGDASRYVADYCRIHADDSLRIYACGGDGTLNEVVTGVFHCSHLRPADGTSSCGARRADDVRSRPVLRPNRSHLRPADSQTGNSVRTIEVGCYPCGSGNDYVKYWPNSEFHDINALMQAPSVEVDVMRVCFKSLYNDNNPSAGSGQENDTKVRYALNTLNFGFEAEVCCVMDEVRRKPLIGGRMAYVTGIVKSLRNGRHNHCHISIDGNPWLKGDLMLASFANGRYEGGGFLSAPRSLNDDGLIEVTAITPIPVLRFAKMIGYYKNGHYLDRPELQDILSYCRAQRVTIESNRQFCIGIDGEILFGSHFDIHNLHRSLRFILPS